LNAVQKLVFTAGQKAHESLFGAKITLSGFNVSIPCTHSKIMADFELVPGGQSPKTFIETLCFRRQVLPSGFIPSKGKQFSLDMGNGVPFILLQFWNGGLKPDGFTYEFMAVDANYHA
jgi:hypothetical protein